MTTALLLQTTRTRDVADDAALEVLARELAPMSVLAATSDPERTARITGLPTVPTHRAALLRTLTAVDALLVLGGRPLHAGAAPGDGEAFSLPAFYALTTAFRVAGKRVALLGVAADRLEGRHARLARQVVSGSALTVLDSPVSAEHLTVAGLPAPLRVGADLAWLALQAPPRDRSGEELWVSVDAATVATLGGLDAAARTLADLAAADARVAPARRLAVQAWHPGPTAGADLDLAAALVAALTDRHDASAAVVPPATTLAEQRELLGHAAFVVAGQPHALMAAAAAGVPVLGCPADAAGGAVARRLAVPVLPPGGALGRDRLGSLVDRAVSGSGAVLAAVRQHVAAAGEVVDLLRLLLSEGEGPIGAPSGTDPALAPRPTGVMR